MCLRTVSNRGNWKLNSERAIANVRVYVFTTLVANFMIQLESVLRFPWLNCYSSGNLQQISLMTYCGMLETTSWK